MRTNHYHVVENVPGYLPESDPDTCRTKREAEQCARERAKRYREDWDETFLVRGNPTDGYSIERPGICHDLGIVIEITKCDMAECLDNAS